MRSAVSSLGEFRAGRGAVGRERTGCRYSGDAMAMAASVLSPERRYIIIIIRANERTKSIRTGYNQPYEVKLI